MFYRGTVEFRCFNSTLHAGRAKAYIDLCLAMSAQAINQRSTVMRKTHSDNELFTFRVWLVRLGLNGPEFKHTRDHLLANLEGDRAWRYDKDSYEVNQNPPRMTPHLKQEVIKFERYREQFAFLQEQDITTPDQLDAFQTRTEETLATLTKRRTLLNVRKKRRRELYGALADEAALAPAKECFEQGLPDMEKELARYQAAKEMLDQCPIPRERLTEEKAALYQQLAEVNREIRVARKQLALCREIQDHVPQMERDIQTVENKTKEVKRDERGRR